MNLNFTLSKFHNSTVQEKLVLYFHWDIRFSQQWIWRSQSSWMWHHTMKKETISTKLYAITSQEPVIFIIIILVLKWKYTQHRTWYLGEIKLCHCHEETILHDEDRWFHIPPENWSDFHCHHSLHTQILDSHQPKDYSTIFGNILCKGHLHREHCIHLHIQEQHESKLM